MQKPKIPFHCGLFYGAMCHWVGRKPDQQSLQGGSGFYDFLYYPKGEIEKREFRKYAQMLRDWLDYFDITFSRTRVEYSMSAGHDEKTLILRIVISHKVPEQKK